MIFDILVILVLFAVYGSAIWGLALLLRKLGAPPKRVIALSFLIFAAGTGLWAALAWPYDLITLIDFPAVILGDTLYQQSIRYLGDPSSSQAHYTIPWFLRVPQVHFIVSIMFWGVLGLVIQMVRNRRQHTAALLPLLPLS